jgi:hypothetical protein
MVGASVKNLVSSLSEKWHQMGGVRINCIALKQTDIRGTGSLIASVVQTLAFLLSSSSALLTGSTLELHAPSQSTSSASSLVL